MPATTQSIKDTDSLQALKNELKSLRRERASMLRSLQAKHERFAGTMLEIREEMASLPEGSPRLNDLQDAVAKIEATS